jgi:NAD(P)H-flavin reductase
MTASRAPKQYLAGSVAANDAVTGEIFRLECTWPGTPPRAGQFFMLKPKRSSVFLGRPLSAAAWLPATDTVVFLVARRGAGTQELAELRVNEELYLTGPLGNAWEDFLPAAGKIALVGGGIGIAPLAALLCEREETDSGPERFFDVYAGFKKALKDEEHAALLGPARRAEKLILAFEDGAGGRLSPSLYHGRIPDFFDPSPYNAVCACGPEPMLAAVAASCRVSGVPCYVSLERRMACGVGACLGCAVETAQPADAAHSAGAAHPAGAALKNKRCCADGPVFPAREVFFV